MPYSRKELDDIFESYSLWLSREDELTTGLLIHAYRKEAAHLTVRQGFIRRLRSLTHAMRRVFQHVPPDADDPSKEALLDASAYLQSFIINVYAALDNLARIWIVEADVKEGGKPVPRRHIGLGPTYTTVRNSLPATTHRYLSELDGWFRYLENYRHALAHRIPLYIPPRLLDGEAEEAWRALEDKMTVARIEHKHDLWDELLAEQKNSAYSNHG